MFGSIRRMVRLLAEIRLGNLRRKQRKVITFSVIALLLLIMAGCQKNTSRVRHDSTIKRSEQPTATFKLAHKLYNVMASADSVGFYNAELSKPKLLTVVMRSDKRFEELNKDFLLAKDYPDGPNRCIPTLLLKWEKDGNPIYFSRFVPSQ